MKRTFAFTLALLMIVATGMLAQETGTSGGGSSTGTTTNSGGTSGSGSSIEGSASIPTYPLRDAYPNLKNMSGKEIALIGTAERILKIGFWINLVDGTYTLPVVKNFTDAVSLTLIGKQLKLTGKFIYSEKLGWHFSATAYALK